MKAYGFMFVLIGCPMWQDTLTTRVCMMNGNQPKRDRNFVQILNLRLEPWALVQVLVWFWRGSHKGAYIG